MNNYKSILRKIGLYMLIAVSFFIITEACCYFRVYNLYKDVIQSHKGIKGFDPVLKYQKPMYPSYEERKKSLRPVIMGNDEKKGSIVLFGCSFTWGSFMNLEQTFGGMLNKYTGMTVYNRGLYGTGVPFMYYQLNDDNIVNEIKDPKYIIYTLIDDHFYRSLTIRSWCMDSMIQYRYKLKDGKLVLQKPKFMFLYPLYSVFLIQKYIQDKEYFNFEYKEPFIKMVDNSYNLIKEKFPQAQFIIFVYQEKGWRTGNNHVKNNILKHFEDEGIKVIYSDDITGKGILEEQKYLGPDNFHPSSQAWALITPKLIKKLNIN